MPFTPKTWQNYAAGGTPLSAAALIDLEQRLGGYTDIIGNAPWFPTGALDETMSRLANISAASALTSGLLRLSGGIVIPAGEQITSITFITSGAATTPSNQWFCLVKASNLSVLAKTVDDTTTAWGASTAKTLALSPAYTASADEAVYLGVVVVAAGMPTILSQTVSSIAGGVAPNIGGNSTTGLTTPASLGATAGAITATGAILYGYCS